MVRSVRNISNVISSYSMLSKQGSLNILAIPVGLRLWTVHSLPNSFNKRYTSLGTSNKACYYCWVKSHDIEDCLTGQLTSIQSAWIAYVVNLSLCVNPCHEAY